MRDQRFEKLATLLAAYSLNIRRDEKVLIDVTDTPDGFIGELIKAVRKRGGIPIVDIHHSQVNREIINGSDERHAKFVRDIELERMKQVDCYIAIRGTHNSSELSGVPSKSLQGYLKITRPVIDYRVNKTRWVVLRWPTPSMAQAANMSTEAFENFYFDACTIDYSRMKKAMKPLWKRMKNADKVRLRAPGTDLKFSIKGIGAVMSTGSHNIPDGEVYSCPRKESVEGTISFNAPSLYNGFRFENVRLVFRKGKIVDASANDSKRLEAILNTDKGARYVGEFSLGFHPLIQNAMGDILFDEKIAGSLHFTPGQAYEVAGNGNKSAVHWDLVLIQRKECGGGEVWFDDELIRKDGLFIPRDLQGLNPKRLLAGR